MPAPNLGREVRTLLWLQGRLLRRAFRSRRTSDLRRTLSLALLGLLVMPYVFGLSVGLALTLRVLRDPVIVGNVLAVVFTYMLMLWLVSPASGQQVFEPLNLPRLFIHPISFRGLAIGSLITGAVSVATLITVPFMLAALVGAGRRPVDFAVIGVSTALFLVFLVVLKAIATDIIDLIVEDRKLRNVLTAVAVVPWLTMSLGPYLLTNDFDSGSVLRLLVTTRALHYLGWLPSGWLAYATREAVTGHWLTWLAATLLIAVAAMLGGAVHLHLLRRLYFGELAQARRLEGGHETQLMTTTGRLPGLSAIDSARLRALFRKDWLNLRRSPMTPRLALLPVVYSILLFMMTGRMVEQVKSPDRLVLVAGLIVGGMGALLGSMSMFSTNALAFLDHRGLGTLLQMPVPRRLILFSHNLIQLSLAGPFVVILAVVAGLATRQPAVTIMAIAAGWLTLPVSTGIAAVSSVWAPYYVDLERGRASASGAAPLVGCGFLALLVVLAMPIFLMLGIAWLSFRPWFALAVLVAAGYALVLYLILFTFASRTFAGREEKMLLDVVEGR